MKLLLGLFLSVAAFAGEETKEISAVTEFESYKGIMVRTSASPKKFRLVAKQAGTEQICVREGEYTVNGPHPSCGQYDTTERVCSNKEICDWDYTVSPPNYVCGTQYVCEDVTVQRDLSCEHTEYGCIDWDSEFRVSEKRYFEVDTGKLPKLAANQTDAIEFEINKDNADDFMIKNPEGKTYRADFKYAWKCKEPICRAGKVKIKPK